MLERRAGLILLSTLLFCSTALAHPPTYGVVEIAELTGPSNVWAMNGSGEVVGWTENQGWVYRDGELLDLSDLITNPVPEFTFIRPFDIDDGGQIVGDFNPNGAVRGFRLTGSVLYQLSPAPGYSTAQAYGVSGATFMAGTSGHATTESSEASSWVVGAGTRLGVLPGFSNSNGAAVNAARQIVGTSYTCFFPFEPYCEARATLWQSGSMQDLGLLPGFFNSWGRDINAGGQVTGYSQAADLSSEHGFLRLVDGTFIDLGELPGLPFIDPWALNNVGDVVGSAQAAESVPNTETIAFLWREGQIHDLNDVVPPHFGLQLLRAVDVNDAGQIAVLALAADGGRLAVRLDPTDGGGGPGPDPPLVPVSTPVTLLVLAVALLIAGALIFRNLS